MRYEADGETVSFRDGSGVTVFPVVGRSVAAAIVAELEALRELADGAKHWQTGQKIAVEAFNHLSGIASEVIALIDAGISVETLRDGDTVADLRSVLSAAGRGKE